MNAVQIHLALNHAPLFLSIIGAGILLIGMINKNESFKLLSLFILIAAAVLTAPVFLSGEGTEELIENLPGINENALEKHEDMAKTTLIIIIITGLVSVAGLLFRKNRNLSKYKYVLAFVLSLASFCTMAVTAHYGGQIRHSELKNGTANNTEAENEEETTGEEQKISVNDSLNKAGNQDVKKDDD